MHTLLYEWHVGTKAQWSVLVWQRTRLMKDSSPLLFFSCFSWLFPHGKVNSLLGRSSCLATEKTLLFHLFKCSHIPVSTQAHVDRADRAEAAHITFSLVLTSRFFIILCLVVNTALTSSKARTLSFFFTLVPRVPAFLEVPARRNKSRRSKGTHFHLWN